MANESDQLLRLEDESQNSQLPKFKYFFLVLFVIWKRSKVNKHKGSYNFGLFQAHL